MESVGLFMRAERALGVGNGVEGIYIRYERGVYGRAKLRS